MTDKFTWKAGDLNVVKLVYKGVNIDIPVQDFAKLSEEEKEAYIKSKKREEINKMPITPVQAFVNNIVFPKSLEEVLVFSERGAYNVEDILYDEETVWTVPNWAKIGDIVFFMHSKTAIQTIRKLCTALRNQNEYDKDTTKLLQEWLDRGRDLYNEYGGKIYAVGQVTGNPGGIYDDDEDSLETIHWKARIYAEIKNIWVLDNPIDISEFNQFIYISRLGAITPVYGDQFEKLKELIISKNPDPPAYFIKSLAAPVPLAKIDDANWLTVANEYRRSFLLEQQFRSFYVDRFLPAFGDQKKTFRECRIKKHGIPDSFVDNIILFNGKYLPVEVKLNVDNEVDLPGQVKKYCNDDVRFTDHTAKKAFDNAVSYMNMVLIIDTEAVYLYDDRSEGIEKVIDLDEINTVEDIQKLRQNLIGLIMD